MPTRFILSRMLTSHFTVLYSSAPCYVHGAWHEGPDKSPRIMQATDSSLACTFKYFKDRKKRYSSWLVP